MLALLRTPRWLGFTALVLVAIIGFGLLSHWQFTRAEERREQRAAIELATRATVTNFAEAMSSDEFTGVSLTGTFVPGSSLLVRNRPLNGGNGYWVVSQWEDSESQERAWVVRGWIPAQMGAATQIAPPSEPTGAVELRGITRSFEQYGPRPGDLPNQQVQGVDLEQLGAPTTTYWIQATQTQQPLIPIPIPEVDEGRNISYAWQWILFSSIALGGWFIFLRREAQHVRETSRT